MGVFFWQPNFNKVVSGVVAMLPSIEHRSGFHARVAFTVNSQYVFHVAVEIVDTCVDSATVKNGVEN